LKFEVIHVENFEILEVFCDELLVNWIDDCFGGLYIWRYVEEKKNTNILEAFLSFFLLGLL
jgi:hypothetical protein